MSVDRHMWITFAIATALFVSGWHLVGLAVLLVNFAWLLERIYRGHQ